MPCQEAWLTEAWLKGMRSPVLFPLDFTTADWLSFSAAPGDFQDGTAASKPLSPVSHKAQTASAISPPLKSPWRGCFRCRTSETRTTQASGDILLLCSTLSFRMYGTPFERSVQIRASPQWR